MNDDENTNLKLAKNIIHWCANENISLLDNYHDWLRVMFALKNTFADENLGLDLFLQLSAFSNKFNRDECIKKWQDNPPNIASKKSTMGTIIYMAKLSGWRPPKNFHLGNRNLLNKSVTAMEESEIRLKYNELTHQLYYSESTDSENWQLVNDCIEGKIRLDVLEMSMKRDEFESFIKYIPTRFNPIKEFLADLPEWDGKDRFPEFTSTLKFIRKGEEKMALKLLRRWFIGVINGLHNTRENESNPSVSPNENLLILIGKQGNGKTRWTHRLLPPKWYFLFAEKPNMNFSDKDDKLLSCEKAIIAMDEMSPWLNNKTSNEQLKSFLSQKKFNIRVAYGKYNSEYYKIASIIGTSNHSEIITDPTGSRRFWPFEIESADYLHKVDMAQLWAQTYHEWKEGEQHWLSYNELAELYDYNESYRKIHPYEEYISRFVDHGTDFYSATEISEFINECVGNPNATNPNILGVYMKKAGYENDMRWNGSKSKRGYEVTLLSTELNTKWDKKEAESEMINGKVVNDPSQLF